MEQFTLQIYIACGAGATLLVAILVFLVLKNYKLKIDNAAQMEKRAAMQNKFDALSRNLESLNAQKINDEVTIAKLQTKLEEQARINEELKSHQNELDAKSKEYFDLKTKEMSQSLLNLNSKALGENSQKILENLINPLKNEIEKYQKENQKLGTIFSTNFENLKSETKNIMNQAKGLAEALSSNKKVLGNWGEIQLDNVLNASGLELGKNYRKQVPYKDKNGAQKYLDVVVKFDETKKAIIDAKCSLVNYVAHHNATDALSKAASAKALAKDVKNHIDLLSSKDYQEYDSKGYEYIFMFIPNDNIFYTALNQDSTLYEYAYERGIFITTPLTLLMALKTVYICWRNLKSDEMAVKILDEAGKIYDKFSVFISYFDRLQLNLGTAAKTLEDMDNAFRFGKGNLLSRFENFKKLGAKTTKTIGKDYEKIEDEKIYTNKDILKAAQTTINPPLTPTPKSANQTQNLTQNTANTASQIEILAQTPKSQQTAPQSLNSLSQKEPPKPQMPKTADILHYDEKLKITPKVAENFDLKGEGIKIDIASKKF